MEILGNMVHIEILGNEFVQWKYLEIWGILKYWAMDLYSGNIGNYGANRNIGQCCYMDGNGEFKSNNCAYGLPSLIGGYLAAEMD